VACGPVVGGKVSPPDPYSYVRVQVQCMQRRRAWRMACDPGRGQDASFYSYFYVQGGSWLYWSSL
jgi:hypothetical protein